ncbi:type VII secretion protein EccE [Nocardia iowensis]|uniref:Type VII secretion protein EccE n=1 Tax=Nocardia iowensis TaxID=204891 RepID=A0ABX8S472_NOCIO|nr:type VII secretion protein EccE [Nocardia iowensis]QXN94681.1 type VII secretion protein EccE [Nocardia iowensis]
MSAPSAWAVGIDRGPFAAAVIGGSLLLAGLSARTPLWVSAVVASVLLAAAAVRWRGRTATRWMLDSVEYLVRRSVHARQRADQLDARDVTVAAGVCGIRDGDTVLVAMIQLAPDLDLPTVIGEKTLYTEDTVPVDVVSAQLDQFGIAVDIDIVATGQRVRSGGAYSMLYDQLIGSQPVVGDRLAWLVVRLDQERNRMVLERRGSVAVVAPKALASAAHRIAGRLREQGIAAHPLPASALHEATRLLHAGIELTDLREKWGHLESPSSGRCVTTFQLEWSRLGDVGLDDCWVWHGGRTTLVVSLTDSATGPRALVRYVGAAVTEPPGYLRPLGGKQSTALLASLPTATSIRALPSLDPPTDIAPDELVTALTVGIGPNGQILGTLSGQPRHTLALPLFDPARYNPRRRTIDVHATLTFVQQLVLRATVVGADVEVHTARPQRWRQLVDAVGDTRSLRVIAEHEGSDPGEEDSSVTIAVFDQLPARASSAHTTVTVSEPGGPHRPAADLVIDQISATAVDVGIPMRTVRVELIEPRGETRYLGSADGPAAITTTPDRTAATHPDGRRVG